MCIELAQDNMRRAFCVLTGTNLGHAPISEIFLANEVFVFTVLDGIRRGT